MEIQLPLTPTPTHTSDLSSLYGPPDQSLRPTIEHRLQSDLAKLELRKAKIASLQLKLKAHKAKLDRRTQSIALQLESLRRNEHAVLRYMQEPSPEYCGDLWQYRPVSDLELEQLPGISAQRNAVLTDRCPTVGDLEILRVYEGLTSLPGIDKALAGKIETKLFNWLSRNAWGYRPAASFEHVGRRRESGIPREFRVE